MYAKLRFCWSKSNVGKPILTVQGLIIQTSGLKLPSAVSEPNNELSCALMWDSEGHLIVKFDKSFFPSGVGSFANVCSLT